MKTKIKFLILIFIYLFILTGCTNNKEYSIEDKMSEEINYLENEMIEITNNFVLENYKNKESFEFDKLIEDTRKIEDASNRIMVDLASQNISNEEIGKLSDGINKMVIAASEKDELRYLIELNNVFSLFPSFASKITSDNDEIFERRLKYFTISSCISFLVGDKELSKNQIKTLESEYLEKQKDVKYVENHKYNLNKIYLLIEELKKAIENDSEELVKEKYLLLVEEL